MSKWIWKVWTCLVMSYFQSNDTIQNEVHCSLFPVEPLLFLAHGVFPLAVVFRISVPVLSHSTNISSLVLNHLYTEKSPSWCQQPRALSFAPFSLPVPVIISVGNESRVRDKSDYSRSLTLPTHPSSATSSKACSRTFSRCPSSASSHCPPLHPPLTVKPSLPYSHR